MIKMLMTYSNKEGLEKLFNNKNFNIDVVPKPDVNKFKEIIPDYDGLLIRSEVKVTREIVNVAKNLKLVVRAGTGVDNIDIKASTERGIVVMNVPGGNTISACEHTFALLLSMARNIPHAYNSIKSGEWKRDKFVGIELFNKTLGIIGFGRIGREVARRALSYGMKVIVYDPFVSEDFIKSFGDVELKTLDEIYKEADFITIHTPLNDSTKHLINKQAIEKMKTGVILVNCARGGIIDEIALYDALKSGKVKSAALDVFEKEPLKDSPLLELDNVILTPHLGASTEEAQLRIAQEVSEMIVDFFEKNIVRNAINIPSVAQEIYKILKPYLGLIEKMGSFQGQIIEGGIKQINLEYAGEISNFNTAPLTTTYLKELLTRILDIKVNLVNAQYIAIERGIKIKETKIPTSENYSSLIDAKIITDKMESNVSGILFSHKFPRIVNINDLDIDISPEGCMLFVENIDKPGIIGQIGTILGENNINIGGMQVGRKESKGNAITIVNVDVCPEKEIIDRISKINGITSVKLIVV